MVSGSIEQGLENVVDTLVLIGSDHFTDVRKYVRSVLGKYRPELISLEHEINLVFTPPLAVIGRKDNIAQTINQLNAS